MSKKLKRDIGTRLNQAREALHLSQRKMAADLMTSRSTYSKNELGTYFPSVGVLHTMGVDKEISMDWLICERGGMFDHRSQLNGEIIDFVSGSPELEELLYLMKNVPLMNHKIMEAFHQFKRDNPLPVEKALKEKNER